MKRISALLLALAISESTLHHSFACGGWNEETIPLSDYADRLPAKSLGEIYLETTQIKPSGDDAKVTAEINTALNKMPDEIGVKSNRELLAEVDQFLVQARAHYSDANTCNLLHDVHDLLEITDSKPDEIKAYLTWRLANQAAFQKPPPSQYEGEEQKPVSSTIVEPDISHFSGNIRAQWIYAHGANAFLRFDYSAAKKDFDEITTQFPNSPRAEIALFMSARCGFKLYKPDVDDFKTVAARFQEYILKYPHGQYVADAYGWLGGIAYDSNDQIAALRYYIQQAEVPGHPELLKPCVLMIEKTIENLPEQENDDALFSLIAQYPRAAMGYMYYTLNTQTSSSNDANFDSAKVKKWKQTTLLKIADAVAKQKEHFKSVDWQPRYLAIMAQAASAAGKQGEAIQLTAVSDAEKNDDLLFARGVAQERAGKANDAIETYETLLKLFPKSPLASGVRLRLAMAQKDNHQAGDALVNLIAFVGNTNASDDSGTFYTSENNPAINDGAAVIVYKSYGYSDQVAQMIDTLLNFAPLTEIVPATKNEHFSPKVRDYLSGAIAQRYLAREDFENAKKFLADADKQKLVDDLEKKTMAVSEAKNAEEKAANELALGDAWEAARGKLLLTPLDKPVVYNDGLDSPERTTQNAFFNAINYIGRPGYLLRRANGESVGFSDSIINNELESRDELRHAAHWWNEAAQTLPGSRLAVHTLFKSLTAIPKITAYSDFAFSRMRATDSAKQSKMIYETIRKEFPNSWEARHAAWWSFPSLQKNDDESVDSSPFANDDLAWINDGIDSKTSEILGKGYIASDDGAFGKDASWVEDDDDSKTRLSIEKQIDEIHQNIGSFTLESLRDKIDEVKKTAHEKLKTNNEGADILNFLDDLSDFLHEPNVTLAAGKKYFDLRRYLQGFTNFEENGFGFQGDQDNGQKNLSLQQDCFNDPAFQKFHDYLDFLSIGNMVRGVGSQPSEDIEAAEREFLAQYPHSKKREAVTLLLARLLTRQSMQRSEYVEKQGHTPQDDLTKDNYVFETYRSVEFDYEKIARLLDAYDKEFPHGSYAAEMRNLRGVIEWEAQHWSAALDETLAQLDDAGHQALRPEAAIRLASIFAELANDDLRPDVLDAILKNPKAVERLRQYLAVIPANKDHPLRMLGDYLTTQIQQTQSANHDHKSGSRSA